MKKDEKTVLFAYALAPVSGFFPVEIHYALMRALDLGGFNERSEITSIQAPDASYHLLVFLEDWLSTIMATAFALGVFRLRHLIRIKSEVTSFPLLILLFFAGGALHFITPHLIPFFFGIVMLAIITNTRLKWAEAKSKDT